MKPKVVSDRLKLMGLFRADIQKIDPADHGYPSLKNRPDRFKYEHHTFLFDVWMAGRLSTGSNEVSEKYRAAHTSCNCHPETCFCKPYGVFEGNRLIDTHSTENAAIKKAKFYNEVGRHE